MEELKFKLVSLQGQLNTSITPYEFTKISDWYTQHLKNVLCSQEGFNPDHHKLEWEAIETGWTVVKYAKCSCGKELNLTE